MSFSDVHLATIMNGLLDSRQMVHSKRRIVSRRVVSYEEIVGLNDHERAFFYEKVVRISEETLDELILVLSQHLPTNFRDTRTNDQRKKVIMFILYAQGSKG